VRELAAERLGEFCSAWLTQPDGPFS